MSVAVMATDGKRFAMATDQMACGEDGSFEMLPRGKSFWVGPMAVAYVGSLRAGQMCRDVLDWPERPAGFSLETYLSRWVVPAAQALFRDLAPDLADEMQMLVGEMGSICVVHPDGSVVPHDRYAAIGSGGPYAKTVLSMATDPVAAVAQAVEKACEMCMWCRGCAGAEVVSQDVGVDE